MKIGRKKSAKAKYSMTREIINQKQKKNKFVECFRNNLNKNFKIMWIVF